MKHEYQTKKSSIQITFQILDQQSNTVGAQQPTTLAIQMVRIRLELDWFGFRMIKQNGCQNKVSLDHLCMKRNFFIIKTVQANCHFRSDFEWSGPFEIPTFLLFNFLEHWVINFVLYLSVRISSPYCSLINHETDSIGIGFVKVRFCKSPDL